MGRIDDINAELAEIAQEMSGMWDQYMADLPPSERPREGEGPAKMLDWVEASVPRVGRLVSERAGMDIERLRELDFNGIAEAFDWDDMTRAHAQDSMSAEYADECVIPLASGRDLCVPAHPLPCDYVRICQAGFELAYWTADEVREAPEEVLGAIFGAASNYFVPKEFVDLRSDLLARQRGEVQR